MKILILLMFVSLAAVANDSFEECFDLDLTSRVNDPAKVCFSSTTSASGKIDTHEVRILSRSNDMLSKQKIVMTLNRKPDLPMGIVDIKSSSGPYQVSAKRLNGWLSFSYLRDLSNGHIFHEYHYNPNAGRRNNGCNGRGRCI